MRFKTRTGLKPAVMLAIVASIFSAAPLWAQATGVFLCSGGGSNVDGHACEAQTDCPGGACVIAQGVCNDAAGDPCDCPGSVCSAQNTCSGGTSMGGSCDPTTNCTGGASCVGSQKICVGNGSDSSLLPAGFSCLFPQQCSSGQCVSTGRVCEIGFCSGVSGAFCDCPGGTCAADGTCNGGTFDGSSCDVTSNCSTGVTCLAIDFAGFTCAQDADCCTGATCPAGACSSPATGLTPTATVPVRTPTVTRTGGVSTPTPPPLSPTPTITASPSRVAHLQTGISAADTTIVLDNAAGFPNSGTIKIDNELINYTGRSANTLTGVIRGVGGTAPAAHSAQAVVTLVPTADSCPPGGCIVQATAEGGGCSLASSGGHEGVVAALATGLILWVRRLLRSRKSQ